MASSKIVSAIILSGGKGARLQQYGIPKQFIEVAGIPLFIHCLKAYEFLDEIDEVILVINEKFATRYETILDQHHFKKLSAIVPGGELRHVSILNGLAAVKHNGVVVIQNGVNPTTPANIIRQCIETAWQHGAVTAYVPAFHTVFEVANGEIETVLERKCLGYTCDPQAFRVDVLQEALSSVGKSTHNDHATVDLVRRLGRKVKLVPSNEANLKVSTEIDLFTTEIILSKIKTDGSIYA